MKNVENYNDVKTIELRNDDWTLVDTLELHGDNEQVIMGVYRGEEGSIHIFGGCTGFALVMVVIHMIRLIQKESGMSIGAVFGMLKLMSMIGEDDFHMGL